MARRRVVEAGSGSDTDWLSALDVYQVQYVALDKRTDGSLVRRMRAASGWVADLEDREAVLFARKAAITWGADHE
jgi:hypothetical protein